MSKRDYLAHLKTNCDSIGSGNTMIPVLIQLLKPPKDRTDKRSPYTIICTAMVLKSTLVRFYVKKDDTKKPKAEGGDTNTESIGGTINPGDTMVVNCFDRMGCMKLTEGNFVKISCNASNYTDPHTNETRVTFKSDRILFDKNTNALTKVVYDRYIMDTDVAEVPTRYNIKASSFKEGTPQDYMRRKFLLPLSSDQKKFNNVEIIIERNRERMYCRKDDINYVGFNSESGDKVSNSIGVVYEPLPTEAIPNPKPIMMKLKFNPVVWEGFGIDDLNFWKPVASRIISNLRDAYIFGYSSLGSIENMKGNLDRNMEEGYGDDGEYTSMEAMSGGGDEESDVIDTTGFIIKFAVNMTDTVKVCGLKLDASYIEQLYDPEERKYSRPYQPFGYEGDNTKKHPMNAGHRLKMKAGTPAIFNVSEIHSEDIEKFFKTAREMTTLKYYGVFADDENRPYEFDGVNVTEFINTNNIKPVIVFAIVE